MTFEFFYKVYNAARAIILVSSDSDAPKTFQYRPDEGPMRMVKISANISARDFYNVVQVIIWRTESLMKHDNDNT